MNGQRSRATIGCWCFAAGWCLAFAVSAAWRLFDWPDWLGAAVILGVVVGAFRAIRRFAGEVSR